MQLIYMVFLDLILMVEHFQALSMPILLHYDVYNNVVRYPDMNFIPMKGYHEHPILPFVRELFVLVSEHERYVQAQFVGVTRIAFDQTNCIRL